MACPSDEHNSVHSECLLTPYFLNPASRVPWPGKHYISIDDRDIYRLWIFKRNGRNQQMDN